MVVGQRLVQAASDVFLGWAEGPTTGHHYYVRQLWDSKGQGNPMEMDVGTLRPLRGAVRLGPRPFARPYRRRGDDLGVPRRRSTKFDRAIAEFSRAYAISNEADHQALVDSKLGDAEANDARRSCAKLIQS